MIKKYMRVFLAGVMLFSMTACSSKTTGEEEGVIEQEYYFETKDEAGKGNFPNQITLNGKTYEITTMSEISYDKQGSEEMVEIEVDVAVEEESEIKEKAEFEYEGEKYIFNLSETQLIPGTIEKTVTTTRDYENYVVSPKNVPRTTDVDVTIGGETKTYEGKLVGVEQVSDYVWQDNLVITGMWTGAPDATQYNLAGTQITVPYDAQKPLWGGFGADILTAMGLSSNHYRVTDGYWRGNPSTDQSGNNVRYATYTGDQYVANFKATYEVTYTTEGYQGKAVYRANADKLNAKAEDRVTIYKIKAVVKYKLVETGNQ